MKGTRKMPQPGAVYGLAAITKSPFICCGNAATSWSEPEAFHRPHWNWCRTWLVGLACWSEAVTSHSLWPVKTEVGSPCSATELFRNGAQNAPKGASLVVQWLRIRLPMQETRVRALVREDPTCRGVTKPVHHNYWACALGSASHNYWSPCATTTGARVPRACAPQQEKPPQGEARAPQWRVAPALLN